MWRHEAVESVEDLLFGDIYHHSYDEDCGDESMPVHAYICLGVESESEDQAIACLSIGYISTLWTATSSSDICHIWWESDE